jgi:hypothetical protein
MVKVKLNGIVGAVDASGHPSHCYIAVSDLVDTPPADLPIVETIVLLPTAPVISAAAVVAQPEAIVKAAPIKEEPAVVAPTAKETPGENVLLVVAVPVAANTPAIDALDVILPAHQGIPDKLPKAAARKKVYAYVKGTPAPTKPEDQITLSKVLEMAKEHGDLVLISDNSPWVIASTFFKQYA